MRSMLRLAPTRISFRFLLAGMLAASAITPRLAAQTIAPTPEQRLASELIRGALQFASATPLSSHALDIACMLGSEAVALDPDSAGLWRLVLGIATLAERDDLRAQAIERLTALDPADEGVRLQRLNLALDRCRTVEERGAAYERLLEADSVQRIGSAAASRLALDLALLKQRTGETEAFNRWLTRALELDRSNRSAAALAAGFFQANVNDPVGQAELLVNLVLADPTDVQTQVTLAQHLLEHGAYHAATRVYAIAASGLKAAHMKTSTGFMADIAVAQWAAGDTTSSLATIDRRQAEIDEAYRAGMARANRNMTMVQIGELKGPVDPTLAAVAAVIHAGRKDNQAAASAKVAIDTAEQQITRAAGANPPADAAELATQHLQVAWLALWLGDDAAKAAEHVAEAEKTQPLTDEARQRFDGWQALKKGEIDKAIELLTPLAQDNAATRAGLALALEQAGRTKDAAVALLELNKAQPGTMIGIWASEQLARLLSRRLPLSAQATELERLISSIAGTFDRYSIDSSMAVTLRAIPARDNPGAFDPIPITVSLTNATSLPLALDPTGPLRPQVLVIPQVNTSLAIGATPMPLVIDLGSRLRLGPRETVTTTFDLRWYPVGTLLNALATVGGIVKITLDSNFMIDEVGNAMPGLFGQEVRAPFLRIDGVRQDPQWLEKALASFEDPAAPPDTVMLNIALLSNELMLQGTPNALGPEHSATLEKARAAMPAAFGRLDATRQAWTLAVMSHPAPIEGILDMARKSDSRLVRMVCLMLHRSGPNDPMLDAARRGDDPVLRDLADRLAQLSGEASAPTLPAAATSPAATSPASTTPSVP